MRPHLSQSAESELPVDSTKLVESRKFWKENIRKRTLMAEGKCIECFTLNEKLEKLPSHFTYFCFHVQKWTFPSRKITILQ